MTVISTFRATDIQWAEEGYVTVYERVDGQGPVQIVEFSENAPDVAKLGSLFTLTLAPAETPTTVPNKVPQHVPMRVPHPTPQATPHLPPTFTPYFTPNQVPQATPQIMQQTPNMAPQILNAPAQVPVKQHQTPAPMKVQAPNLAPPRTDLSEQVREIMMNEALGAMAKDAMRREAEYQQQQAASTVASMPEH